MPKFVPRERKHKRRAQQSSTASNANANAVELLPVTQEEKDSRRYKLREELRQQQGESKSSSQKRKRLEKYIDTKLKKEENLDLLKKLAAHKVDTTLFQSSKKLGRVTESKRERIQRALNERKAGIDVDGEQNSILFEPRQEHDDDEIPEDLHIRPTVEEQVESAADSAAVRIVRPIHNSTIIGSGLKRPLEVDDTGLPIIKKRQRKSKHKPAPVEIAPESEESDASEWNGFSDDEGEEPPGTEDEKLGVETEKEESDESDIKDDEDEDEEDDDDDSDEESDTTASSIDDAHDGEGRNNKPARISAFKAWADAQRNESLGYTASVAPTNDGTLKVAFKPRQPSPDPDAVKLQTPSSTSYRPAKAVVVTRSEEVQTARLELPVVREEQKIIEAVNHNDIVVICGATGSGKTTQIPQMLFENGYASTGMIGITQPRRVAATSVAARVSHEMGGDFANRVAHQVRYDSNVSRNTAIKFMTDGVLLRELSQDFALKKYSVIVIDEAHERSVNTDILIGMLSRIVPLRQTLSKEQPAEYSPLKLVIMSATLRVTDFVMNDRLFKKVKPPIIEAEGRQYAVTDHFARRTNRDYVGEIIRKVTRGHRKLPPGRILVFLTGQDEIQIVAKALRESLAGDVSGFKLASKALANRPRKQYVETDNVEDESDSDADITGLDDSDEDDDENEFAVEDEGHANGLQTTGRLDAHILPLYAALPTSQQMKVFEPASDGSRMIILATNVAETSLTIPGVRYVFDCGRSKEKCYDPHTGVQEFKIDWISKASASQRRGRAGRTGPGHCYKLYSSAIYEQYFAEHTEPELLRTPIEGTVLQLKNLEVDNVVNFPFPTPPNREQLVKAESLLKNLGAIDSMVGKVTDVGKELIDYPVNPRYGKMLLLGQRNGLSAHTIAMVAALAVGDLFIPQPRLKNDGMHGNTAAETDEEEGVSKTSKVGPGNDLRQAHGRAVAKLSQWDDKSDALKMLCALASHADISPGESKTFCARYFLREKSMSEAQQLRGQLHNILQHQIGGTNPAYETALRIPNAKELSLMKQIVVAGYLDHVAIRLDALNPELQSRKPRRAIEVPYRTLLASSMEIDRALSPEEQELQKNVYVHPNSVLARLSVAEMPKYIIYSELSRPTAKVVGGAERKVRMHPLSTVGPQQLAALADGTPLLDIGKPMGKIEDRDGGKKRECWVPVAIKDPSTAGGVGWPLGAWKVVQVRHGTRWDIDTVIDRGAKKR